MIVQSMIEFFLIGARNLQKAPYLLSKLDLGWRAYTDLALALFSDFRANIERNNRVSKIFLIKILKGTIYRGGKYLKIGIPLPKLLKFNNDQNKFKGLSTSNVGPRRIFTPYPPCGV